MVGNNWTSQYCLWEIFADKKHSNTFGADEMLCSFGVVQEFLRRHALQLNDAGQLISLVFPWQEREASQQLCKDTAQTPHVNWHAIASPQDHFRCSVKAWLDVGVHTLVLITAWPKVYHLSTNFTVNVCEQKVSTTELPKVKMDFL